MINYNQILLEIGPANNLAELDAKINSLIYQPNKLLSFYKKILIALVAGAAAIYGYLGYKGDVGPYKGLQGLGIGTGAVLATYGLRKFIKYKIVSHFIRKVCPSLINNNKISKEEKLKIVNGLIAETKQAMTKVTNEKDKQYCIDALNRLQSALTQIQQQI